MKHIMKKEKEQTNKNRLLLNLHLQIIKKNGRRKNKQIKNNKKIELKSDTRL